MLINGLGGDVHKRKSGNPTERRAGLIHHFDLAFFSFNPEIFRNQNHYKNDAEIKCSFTLVILS